MAAATRTPASAAPLTAAVRSVTLPATQRPGTVRFQLWIRDCYSPPPEVDLDPNRGRPVVGKKSSGISASCDPASGRGATAAPLPPGPFSSVTVRRSPTSRSTPTPTTRRRAASISATIRPSAPGSSGSPPSRGTSRSPRRAHSSPAPSGTALVTAPRRWGPRTSARRLYPRRGSSGAPAFLERDARRSLDVLLVGVALGEIILVEVAEPEDLGRQREVVGGFQRSLAVLVAQVSRTRGAAGRPQPC